MYLADQLQGMSNFRNTLKVVESLLLFVQLNEKLYKGAHGFAGLVGKDIIEI